LPDLQQHFVIGMEVRQKLNHKGAVVMK